MITTESFPNIHHKIEQLCPITNRYRFLDLVKAVYCINLCINNRSVLESCLALNACLIEYEEKGINCIETYEEFEKFFFEISSILKPSWADDYTVEDFGDVQIRYKNKFYRVIVGTGHNNVFGCLNFLQTLARDTNHEDELLSALEYVSGAIDYFRKENINDKVSETRFVIPSEKLFSRVQSFFKSEAQK